MFLALAVLLIHPQIAPATQIPALNGAADDSATISASISTADIESSLPLSSALTTAATSPDSEFSAALPEALAPILVTMASPAPPAFLKSGKPLTVSVAQLQAENRRKQMMWTGLAIASSGAATFDAISTRHAITTYGAVEMNPLLRPFAGNASLFVAIQVAPALLDFAGRKMMYSKYRWVRRVWWFPQSASFLSSIVCGGHNLSYR